MTTNKITILLNGEDERLHEQVRNLVSKIGRETEIGIYIKPLDKRFSRDTVQDIILKSENTKLFIVIGSRLLEDTLACETARPIIYVIGEDEFDLIGSQNKNFVMAPNINNALYVATSVLIQTENII